MTKLAVVILNYNGEKLLPQFLPSVIQHSSPAEIIVIDNGSTDRSLNILRDEFPSVRLIVLDKNYGFCGGYNFGLKQVEAEYFVLLNSDVEVTPRWLDPMIALAESNASIAAIQPKILAYSVKDQFEYAGAGGGYIDVLGYPFCRGRLFTYVEKDKGQYNDTREVFWASGACLMIRAKTYHQFQGLDEDFFAHMEEIDLCWKINRTQQKVFYCGQSTVYHLGAGTLGYESPRKTYLNFRNGLTLLFKHLDTVELFYKLPMRIALDWLAAIVFLTTGRAANAGSVLKAHIDFAAGLSAHRHKRRAIRSTYPTYRRNSIYTSMIVLDYYLRGKRKIEVNNPK
jgi:GT2 family glycosyltransferase